MTTIIQEIPLSKLVPSALNVRRTAPKARVDELAASIAAHGLLQNLTVRLAESEGPRKRERFEVIAGGRRLAALKLLAKRKLVPGNAPIPCHVIEEGTAEEISLAENVLQCPMHPADQFEAFAKLHGEHGMAAEDIAARFGVTAAVVRQRLKLGAVSPALMQLYRDGDMNLDQLSAFTITDDHALQERVWEELPSFNRRRDAILAKLNEDSVPLADRRARFVGEEAYQQAGGIIIRDLFDEEGGFLADAALLDRMVQEKLEAEANAIRAEGWKWVETMAAFDYEAASRMRRIYPEPPDLSEEDAARLDALQAEFAALEDDADGGEAQERIEQEIAGLYGEERFAPELAARAGAFVCLSADGSLRIERGFLRREDCRPEKPAAESEGEAPKGAAPLSNALIAELSSHRTAALRHALGQEPDVALRMLTHAMVYQSFAYGAGTGSCIEVSVRSLDLSRHAAGFETSRAGKEIAARHEAWARRLPAEAEALWSYVMGLATDEVMALLAHCTSLTLNGVAGKFMEPERAAHADRVAAHLGLDMSGYWEATEANYFARVSKDRILEAVREGVSGVTADALASLKKQALAKAAGERLSGKGWLPELLRTPAA